MAAKNLTDAYVRHALSIVRVSNGLNAEATSSLRALSRQVRERIKAATLGNRTGVRALLKELNVAVDKAFASIMARQTMAAARIVEIEARWAVKVGNYATSVAAAAMARAHSSLVVTGLTLEELWKRTSEMLKYRMAAEIRNGIIAKQAAEEIADRITDVDGSIGSAMRAARGNVDAAAQAAADAGRRAAMRANGVDSVRWLGMLDPKICPSCGERTGKLWTIDGEPVGHSIPYAAPPLHPYCRCILLPLKHKDGIPPKDGGPMKNKFEDWLSELDEEEQDDVLGRGRARLWREGLITTHDLIGQNGLALTLAQLRELADEA